MARFLFHKIEAPEGRLFADDVEPAGEGWVDTPAKFDPNYVPPPASDGSVTLAGVGVYVPVSFPAHYYNKRGVVREVASAAELEALDPEEWKDSPAAFGDVAPAKGVVDEKPVKLSDEQSAELYTATVEAIKGQVAGVTSPAMLAAIETAEALSPKGPRVGVLKAIAARRNELTQ